MSERRQQRSKRSPPNDPPVVTPTSPPESTIRSRPSGLPIPSTHISMLRLTSDRVRTIDQTRGIATEASDVTHTPTISPRPPIGL